MFKPGQSGNPAGRPKGSRNKLNEDFLKNLQDLWTEKGPEILEATAKDSPETIVKVMASLLPKQIEVSRPVEEMSDAELAAAVDLLRTVIAQGAGGGAGASQDAEPAAGLPTLQ